MSRRSRRANDTFIVDQAYAERKDFSEDVFASLRQMLLKSYFISPSDFGREKCRRNFTECTWEVEAEIPSGYPLTLVFEMLLEDSGSVDVKSGTVTYINESGGKLMDRVSLRGNNPKAIAKSFFAVTEKHLDKLDATWKWASKSSALKNKVIKLAHDKPELRKHLLPLLKTAAASESNL